MSMRFTMPSEVIQAYTEGILSRDEARSLLGIEPSEKLEKSARDALRAFLSE